MKVIDPHLHLLNLAQGAYRWLEPESPPYWPGKQKIHRTVREQDLKLDGALELAGFVHIEAGFDNAAPWRELAWLERHCRLPFRSIGFADLTQSGFSHTVMHLQRYTSLVGIRHILGEDAAQMLAMRQVRTNLAWLSRQRLLFEAQLSALNRPAVEQLCRQMEATPDLRVTICHGGFPPLDLEDRQHWQASLRRLADFPRCAIKCSGWEMMAGGWSPGWAAGVIRQVVDRFGAGRVMLASNFPVCTLRLGYGQLWRWYSLLPGLTEPERQALCFANARRWYGF